LWWGLTRNQIGGADAVAIADAVAKKQFADSDRFERQTTSEIVGAQAIAKAIEQNKFLRDVNLNCNPLCIAGVCAITEAIKLSNSMTTVEDGP